MNITNTLNDQIAAILDGATPVHCYAAVHHLNLVGHGITDALYEVHDIATGGKSKWPRTTTAHVRDIAWAVAKALSFDSAKCRTVARRIRRIADQLHRAWYDKAEQQDPDAARAILFSGAGERLELGRAEARAIALAIAGLPPTAKAIAKSRQAGLARVFPRTNRRTPDVLVWLN
jgi:hypothetical protein